MQSEVFKATQTPCVASLNIIIALHPCTLLLIRDWVYPLNDALIKLCTNSDFVSPLSYHAFSACIRATQTPLEACAYVWLKRPTSADTHAAAYPKALEW